MCQALCISYLDAVLTRCGSIFKIYILCFPLNIPKLQLGLRRNGLSKTPSEKSPSPSLLVLAK